MISTLIQILEIMKTKLPIWILTTIVVVIRNLLLKRFKLDGEIDTMTKDRDVLDMIREAVDGDQSGKIDPAELPNALRMIRELDELKDSEKRALKMRVIRESVRDGSIGTVSVVIGVTLAGIILGLFTEYGFLIG